MCESVCVFVCVYVCVCPFVDVFIVSTLVFSVQLRLCISIFLFDV